jgi:hypothetical protein
VALEQRDLAIELGRLGRLGELDAQRGVVVALGSALKQRTVDLLETLNNAKRSAAHRSNESKPRQARLPGAFASEETKKKREKDFLKKKFKKKVNLLLSVFTMKRDTIKVGAGHIDDIGTTRKNLCLDSFFNNAIVKFENDHLR